MLKRISASISSTFMSCFVEINTEFVDKNSLVKALKSLGFRPEKASAVRGFAESHTPVEFRFRPVPDSYQVGFRKQGERYVCVADWFGVRGIQLQRFLETLTQEYCRVDVGRL